MSLAKVVTNELEALIEPVCRAHGVELVLVRPVQQRGGVTLQIFIDRPEGAAGPDGSGVTIDDCTSVSRDLSTILDLHEELVPSKYNLEVSSPGLERPLVKLADYERFKGREAKVSVQAPIDGSRRFQGTITQVEGDTICLDLGTTTVRIPHAQVTKAHLIYRF